MAPPKLTLTLTLLMPIGLLTVQTTLLGIAHVMLVPAAPASCALPPKKPPTSAAPTTSASAAMRCTCFISLILHMISCLADCLHVLDRRRQRFLHGQQA